MALGESAEDKSLPDLTPQRLLPDGIHTMAMEDVRRLFGTFQRTDRRVSLFAKLEAYMAELRSADLNVSVILNGSFVMACVDAPEDIDLILVLPAEWDLEAELRPFEYNLVSKRAAKRRYGFDVFAVREGSEEEVKWVEFFAQVNIKWTQPPHSLPIDCKKGLVRIVP